ncbi:uncharacterized protein LOC129949390 isoform X1 [Eupeodes corollae]|uniref:uncharacterized protein LOC129949390 isoform X1 n=1 Tax=Eupeodes corollae TaxID=290404 RepID=UPI0024919D5A|nr:uncharacterized protein LOC129949390 isoform X1 [Eupeodes corollae]
MHSVGIHSALAIKRQRKRRDEQKRARGRRYSTQSSDSGDTLHSPNGSVKRRHNHYKTSGKAGTEMLETQVVTSIGMLHIGVVFVVFGIFLLGAGIIPDDATSWNVFGPTNAWWNEVTCTGLFSLGLGIFLLVLNCVISRKEEEDLEDYVQRQLTRSRSGHRLERDVETGVLTTRHTRKAVALQQNSTRNIHDISSNTIIGESCDNDMPVDTGGFLEKIAEEESKYMEDQNGGISPLENDKRYLLRRDSPSNTINITRI